MVKFDLQNAAIFQAVKFREKAPLIFVFGLLLVFFLMLKIPAMTSGQSSGLFFILFCLAIIFYLGKLFFNAKLKNLGPKPSLLEFEKLRKEGREINLADCFDFDSAYLVWRAIKLAKERGLYPAVSSAVLFILLDNPRFNFIFRRAELDKKKLKKLLKQKVFDEKIGGAKLEDLAILTFEHSLALGHEKILIGDILAAAAFCDPTFRKFLFDADIEVDDIRNLTLWEYSLHGAKEKRKKFWKYENLLRILGSTGRAWAAAFTINLDRFSEDLTQRVIKETMPRAFIGHQSEIETVERILAKTRENNVLIVGEPGVGRTTVIDGFIKKTLSGQSLPSLNYQRVLELDMNRALAGLNTMPEINARLEVIFREALRAGNVILVIDQIHNFVGGGPGLPEISQALIPFLESPDFRLIGVTDYEGYHRNIRSNAAVANLFGKVEVKEPSPEESLLILEDSVFNLEWRHRVFVPFRTLKEIIRLSIRYIQQAPLPKKAVDLLDEAMLEVSSRGEKIVLPSHVQELLSRKIEIPLGELQEQEREKLLKLEEIMHQRVIDQEEAIRSVAIAMRRERAGLGAGKKPIGTFLFLGPTGVGKTETAKTLCEVYFGSEKRMIRLDMSEYQEITSIDRLIGSPDGREPGQLTTKILEDPFSVVLLDEIEKAHPDILNLFLQVLDEGRLTDSLGRTVGFLNSIIIATSNAGSEYIREALKRGLDLQVLKEELLDQLQKQGIFRAEFLNRFDAVVVFQPLSKEHLLKIAELMLGAVAKKLREQDLRLSITPELLGKIVELGFDPQFGARQMRRVIQDKIESLIAQKILKKEVRRGEVIYIDLKEIS